MDLHCSTCCTASMQVTSLEWKNLPEAVSPPAQSVVSLGALAGELTPRSGPSVQTRGERAPLPHKWTGPGPNHMNWTEKGKEEGRKQSRAQSSTSLFSTL